MHSNLLMQLGEKEVRQFQKKILSWYRENKRHLPWRTDRDPYHILISEVMLQQTQVSRVIPKYKAWMQTFPDIQSLAKASTHDVLRYWSGLGYNRRALYLKKCAEILIQKTQGFGNPDVQKVRNSNSLSFQIIQKIVWPKTEKELQQLPGIGEYTARALLCFAFNKQVTVVDTNVKKVILTLFSPEQVKRVEGVDSKKKPSTNSEKKISDKVIQQIANKLLPKGRAYDWNQALMDYASQELKGTRSASLRVKKQSAFLNSDRFYRGLTIKLLLQKKQVRFNDLLQQVRQVRKVESKRYSIILDKLQKEKLLIKKDAFFMLPQQ